MLDEQTLLPTRLRDDGVDALHCVGGVVPFRGAVPSLLSVITMHHKVVPREIGLRRAAYRTVMFDLAVRKADVVIVNSQSNKADVMRYLPVAEEKIAHIPDALDEVFLQPADGEQSRRVLAGARGSPALPHVRLRHVPVQGPGDAARRVRRPSAGPTASPTNSSSPGTGRPPYLDQLHRRAVDLGVDDRTVWVGHQGALPLRSLYAEADVFVYPSLYETFGHPPLQAMGQGTPVVASNCSSIPEVVGDAALLFEPGDANDLAATLRRLLGDGALRARLVDERSPPSRGSSPGRGRRGPCSTPTGASPRARAPISPLPTFPDRGVPGRRRRPGHGRAGHDQAFRPAGRDRRLPPGRRHRQPPGPGHPTDAEAAGRPGGMSILERNVRTLAAAGFRELIVNTHHLAEQVLDHLGDGSRFGVRIDWSHEPELLGTAGALLTREGRLRDRPFVVVYGDNLLRCDVVAPLDAHAASGAVLTVTWIERTDCHRSGVLTIGTRGRLVAFVEKPAPRRRGQPDLPGERGIACRRSPGTRFCARRLTERPVGRRRPRPAGRRRAGDDHAPARRDRLDRHAGRPDRPPRRAGLQVAPRTAGTTVPTKVSRTAMGKVGASLSYARDVGEVLLRTASGPHQPRAGSRAKRPPSCARPVSTPTPASPTGRCTTCWRAFPTTPSPR